MRKSLWVLAFVVGLPWQCVRADETGRFEQQLAAVMRWEILWNDVPRGFHIPAKGPAKLAIYLTSSSLSYCSHDLSVCARYRIDPNRNWERVAISNCDGNQSDEEALAAFIGDSGRSTANAGPPRKLALGGTGGLTGSPAAGSGIRWTTVLTLGSRDEIVQQYKQVKPTEISNLTSWIRSSMTQPIGRTSIIIACFAPTDPMVYYYVDRPSKESVVMAAIWDREREGWVVASSFVRSQNPQTFDVMHRIIESVACSTIRSE